MSPLIAFLLERIADDESLANGIDLPSEVVPPNTHGLYWADAIRHPYAELHITRERLLSEVAAKRTLVDLHAPAYEHYLTSVLALDAEGFAALELASRSLLTIALPYADHPDFDESWRPA